MVLMEIATEMQCSVPVGDIAHLALLSQRQAACHSFPGAESLFLHRLTLG